MCSSSLLGDAGMTVFIESCRTQVRAFDAFKFHAVRDAWGRQRGGRKKLYWSTLSTPEHFTAEALQDQPAQLATLPQKASKKKFWLARKT